MYAVPRSAKVVHPFKEIEFEILKSVHANEHWWPLLTQIMRHFMAPTEGIKPQKNLCCFQ